MTNAPPPVGAASSAEVEELKKEVKSLKREIERIAREVSRIAGKVDGNGPGTTGRSNPL